MKLTLWNQFSSNHSASFTVVGRCASIEKAIEVEQILKTLFAAIMEYRSFQLPRLRLVVENDGPTWPEVEAAEKYNIEWKQGFDWISDKIDGHVKRYEQYVFVGTTYIDTWQSATTLENLMSRLADEMYVQRYENYPDTLISIEIHAAAPDEQIAQNLTDDIQHYLNAVARQPSGTVIAPWEAYYTHIGLHINHPEVQSAPYWSVDPAIVRTVIQAFYRYQRTRKEPHQFQEARAVALKALRLLAEQGYIFKSEINEQLLLAIIVQTDFSAASAHGGQIKRMGRQLHIPKIWFHEAYDGLPAFIEYLKDTGCADIRYRFVTLPYDSPNPMVDKP